MKKFTARLTTALLCAAMVVSTFAACANNEEEKKPNVVDPNKQQETQEDTPEFEEEDWGGRTYTILSKQDEETDFIDHFIDNEDFNGEPINDAVVTRNQLAEEKYNIKVERQSHDHGYAAQASKSGTVDFEVIYDWGIRMARIVMDGVCYDFNQLPYIDLTQDYWAPNMHEDLTIADKMMMATCDISMNRIAWASVYFFNKTMMDELNLEYPYSYVTSNTWTFDVLLSQILAASQDDGDQIWTVYDRYGMAGSGSVGLPIGCANIPSVTRREDGSFEIPPVNERLVSLYTEWSKKMITYSYAFANFKMDEWLTTVDQSQYESVYKAARGAEFGSGRILYFGGSLDMTGEFTDVPFQYGVCPGPKYDTTDEFSSGIDTCAPLFAIPKQADLEFAGMIMEYLAYESEQHLLPAFYDQTLKTKRMDDEQSRDDAMIDIVRDTAKYPTTGLYYLVITNAEGDCWNPPATIRSEMLAAGNFASVYKRYKDSAQKSLDDFYDKMLMLDVNK